MKPIDIKKEALLPFEKMVNDTGDVERLTNELEGVKRLLFTGKEEMNISQRTKEYLSEKMAHIFSDLEILGLEPTDDTGRTQFIDTIIAFMRKLPKVKVTLAFDPSMTFVSNINREISNQAGQKVILDVVVDQHVVAGAAFEFMGKYKQYTMAKDVEVTISDYIRNTILSKRGPVNSVN